MASPHIGPDTPFFIVLNAGSGSEDAAQARQVIDDAFAADGRRHRVFLVDGPGRVQALAREAVERARAVGGVVVAAGGDGTINAVAQATLGSGCPFGVLPQGTFNYFSRTHGIPRDTAQALQVLLTQQPRAVQVGLVNDRVFLVNASMGLYADLLEERESHKARFGRHRWIAFYSGLLTVLRGRHRHWQLRIASHGHEQRGRADVALLSAPGHAQVPEPVTAHHGQEPRKKRDPAAAAVARLVAFALFQQLGVQPHAGIDQEHAVVHQPHLRRLRLRGQQHLQRLGRIARNAMGAAEIVEGALRQHAKGQPAAERGLRHGVDGAVAARGHHHAADCAGPLHRLARERLHRGALIHKKDAVLAAGRGAAFLDDPAGLGGVRVARAGVENDEQGGIRTDLGRQHVDGSRGKGAPAGEKRPGKDR